MKDKIKYYLLLLAFLFIMALILWFFHDWIEQYSNSLMVLITFIYVVATIEICRANIKSAEATKEQLEESKRQFAENERLQMMPYFEIIVHDDIRDFVECIGLTISNSNAENSTVIDRRISIKNIGLGVATVYKGNIIKNLIMDCQSYTKYRPNETTGGIFVSWRRKEELPTGA